ncbi:LOW QUALITY PROTEIN: hypothetical protein CVT25_015874 [Psilocybe cyanescens]|uniref:endo-polygalacturonase n=1 Tax=Psilocybe cyanescens TaxID=93625 RepID=A0A409XIJ3_PSICY|nr:LOW QUALITY PROTEIN: hypothetical protein CVT25_015874 [Psilocybe cyanescens]
MISALSVLILSGAATLANAACSATINSLSDVADAVKCTSITLNGFTVPAGQGLSLSLASGTTVTMNGDISFGNKSWDGPLFTVRSVVIDFRHVSNLCSLFHFSAVNGNGHKFDGGGPFYWDGQGINGGTQKPDPMMKIKISGTFEKVKVVNSPGRVFSVSNPAALTMTDLTIDNSQGDAPNSLSGGKAAGHNTDGFDVSSNNLIIQNSLPFHMKDDCLAINKGTNIVFQGNSCTGGHGISIGSIDSDVTVSGIVISGNTITNNDQALRIKTKSSSTGSTVSNVTYSGNTATGIRQFGILIDESYPDTLGTPGTGVIISGINFGSPATTISVNSDAQKVAVNCGKNACTGTWNWSNLKVSGGVSVPLNSQCSGALVNKFTTDIAVAVNCTTVILNGFTVPAGQGLTLNLKTGTTVTMSSSCLSLIGDCISRFFIFSDGDISFGNLSWVGPLFTVSGKSITFNGNGHIFDGGGPFYWDGLGGNGGVVKPAPMMKIKISGVYANVTVVNSPTRVYSVSNPAPLVMTDLIIDNSQGDVPNDQSNGLAAGHNTDGFDCSTTDLIIQNSLCAICTQKFKKDDCLAINKGSNIVFQNNTCINGHGISVGSIDSNVVVSGVVISRNTIIENDQALRIKTKALATNSTVTNITYAVGNAV